MKFNAAFCQKRPHVGDIVYLVPDWDHCEGVPLKEDHRCMIIYDSAQQCYGERLLRLGGKNKNETVPWASNDPKSKSVEIAETWQRALAIAEESFRTVMQEATARLTNITLAQQKDTVGANHRDTEDVE